MTEGTRKTLDAVFNMAAFSGVMWLAGVGAMLAAGTGLPPAVTNILVGSVVGLVGTGISGP